jgi:16S rRNA (cytidine1402-2'-O)-methyltransferase
LTGKIYLIPVSLGGDDPNEVIPAKVLSITKSLRYFVVENIRSARRYLRQIDKTFPVDDSRFFELNEHTGDSEIAGFLEPVVNGNDIGLMSEAGLPCIADPGTILVSEAHKKNIKIIPLAGPSSILLSLIASGLNGQNFTFNGYLPAKPGDREAKLREIEKRSRSGEAQIFMETPYRSQKMFESIIRACNGSTMLCIATDLTLPQETVRTKLISGWKTDPPDINDKLVIFIIQSGNQ